jgi:hypothetical protein
VLITMMVSTGTRDSSKNGTVSAVLAKSVLVSARVRGDRLAGLGHHITGHGKDFPEMHLRRIRLRREAFALLAEHLTLEPLQLMLQRNHLIAERRNGLRL